MKSKFSIAKSIVIAAALVTGSSGIARADDSSMSRLTGDSYVYFNATRSDASVDPAWRLSHPNGLTQSELQARVDAVWAQRAHEPVLSKVADDPAWRPSHPDGLSNRELQALSSEASAWHVPDKSITGAFASRSTRSGAGSSKGELLFLIRGGDEDHDRKEAAVGRD